jgi:hypothetical protein
MVYPNLLNFLLLQRALHQLVECQHPEEAPIRREDHLLEQAIKWTLGEDPKAYLDMVRYVAILESKEEGNDLQPVQPGGKGRAQGQTASRGFSGRMFSSAAPHA